MPVADELRRHLSAAIERLFGISVAEIGAEIPPRTELGDLAFPVAFDLAKRLKAQTGQKQNPREIARRLAEELSRSKGVVRADVAGPGYVNVYLDRVDYLLGAAGQAGPPAPQLGGKIIVEHTSVNPNKAAHIGHLRNAVLGDTTVRMLRAAGETVEVQNYIDNTGVQVADVVVGFKYIEGKTLDQIEAMEFKDDVWLSDPRSDPNRPPRLRAAREIHKFDYFCWDLYARVGQFYEEDRSRLQLRTDTLHELESGKGETYEMADYISRRVLGCHLETMLRVGIKYDVLPRESDVLHLHIWEKAFDLLKKRNAIEYEAEGRLAGCWVMRASQDESVDVLPHFGTGDPPWVPGVGYQAEEEDEYGRDKASKHEADKVIVRSNGIVTYTGKDIAFHLWKLGQLDMDFYYKPFLTYPNGHVAWVTTTGANENDPTHPPFGSGAAYFNVIDIGQSYPQHYVRLGVMAVDHDQRVERSAHLAYEKVALTPATVEQLGQRLSEEDRKRGAIGMSGRKGLGVKIDDLIDVLEANALVEVANRNPELTDTEQDETAHKIAVGALRYFLLKYSRTSVISFDFKEALSFEGETGPYIQYSVVRANSIFRKLEDAGIDPSSTDIAAAGVPRLAELLSGEEGDELWSLVYLAARLPDTVRGAVGALEPAIVAKWTFQLAQRFNLFYHNFHILSEKDPARRALLMAITTIVRRQLIAALGILGIEAPDRM